MRKKRKQRMREIRDYDAHDVSADIGKRMTFEDIGLKLPELAPTQVVSIRLPTTLLNEIKAICSDRDIPYQGWIKWCMSEAVRRAKAA
jgi:predicted DNA binding CopG/RHH family protein